MAQIAVVTDLHFGARSDDEMFIANHLRFLNEVLFPEIERRGIKHLLNLGDTWDKRKIHNIRTFGIFREAFFNRIEQMGLQAYFLIGNHDIYYKNTNAVNSVAEFANANIHIVNEFEDITIAGTTFGMMSWINNENLERAVEFATSTSKASIICGHFETIGFEVLKGVKCEHGIEASLFERFNRVWSGHFHIPSKQGNFEYIGNPFELTWSDYNTRKGFMIYDTESDTVEYIANPFKMFAVIKYKDDIQVDFTQYTDKLVRVYIQGQTVALTDFINTLQAHAYKVEVIDETVVSVDDIAVTTVENIDANNDTLSKLKTIVGAMELTSVDTNKLTTMVEDLYTNAMEQMR